MRTEIDLDLATAGYLTGPQGGARRICGLDEIARDTVSADVWVYWAESIGGERGRSYLWTRAIYLSLPLWDAEPWLLKSVWAHELGHIVLSKSSEVVVNRWAWQRYGHLASPDREHARPG